jgi:hypothetical protein
LQKTESGYHFQVALVQNYVEQVVEEEELTIFVTEYKEEKQRTFNFHDSFFLDPNRREHSNENLDLAWFSNCLSNPRQRGTSSCNGAWLWRVFGALAQELARVSAKLPMLCH